MARRNIVALIDDLRRDEYYSRQNLPFHEYNEDVLIQWMKEHWEYLEAGRDEDDTLRAIYIDLVAAIDSLPARERLVVRLYSEGYPADEQARDYGIEDASRLLLSGVKGMVRYLKGER